MPFFAIMVLLCWLPTATFAEETPLTNASKDVEVVLRATDKVTAHSSEFRAPVGTVVMLGSLEIIAERCLMQSKPGADTFAALLEIYDKDAEGKPELKFSGWMFSDSPSLSTLEHPYTDVQVLSCEAIPPKISAASEETAQ